MILDLFKRESTIRQSEAGECGLACLAIIEQHYGGSGDLYALRRRFKTSSRGASLRDLIHIADQVGLQARGLQSDIPSLAQLFTPAILHWDLNHYVVLTNVRKKTRKASYKIVDPARGTRVLDEHELARHFTGVVLEVMPTSTFQPRTPAPRLRFSQLWTNISGLWPALGRILVLSVLMQAVALVMPLYMQIAVDTALPAMDMDLLNILAVGFGSLLIINAMVSIVRARLTLNLSYSLGYQTATNLFRHTIFLPVSWFERRHLGDVISRFGSLQPVVDLLSRGLVSSIIDGALTLTTLVLMLAYSPTLTALTVGIVLIYGLAKAAYYNSAKMANANVLEAQAVESSIFIENIRGISAIKMFCQECNRRRRWQNKKAEFINHSLKLGRLNVGFTTVNSFIVAMENVVFIFVAMQMIMSSAFTLGMAFAFQAYKSSFVSSLTRLIDQVVNYRLLGVHLGRISDIAFEKREPDALTLRPPSFETVTLDRVSYSYGENLPPVLRNVNLTIRLSETTAIIGASGSGKTTLLKLICGLLEPTTGRILVDGVPLNEYGVRTYRSQLGVISQDDTLFAGSLAENISFFDADYCMDRIVRCGRDAAVHDEVMKMPMKYDTAVGDMGSNLSGGQKQRILLARALYKEPILILMDEGTAHLDVAKEAEVIASLKRRGTAQILVAHRPHAIDRADKLVRISDGYIKVSRRVVKNNHVPASESTSTVATGGNPQLST